MRLLRIVLVAMMTAGLAATRPAATGLTTTRATEGVKAEGIRQALAGLMDADATVREKGREELLKLKRADLELLKAVVKESRPLAPSQAAGLKEIVQHVYLAEDEYEKSRSGFLGIIMTLPLPGQDRIGVVLENRMPGFCGYRALRDGDAILDVDDRKLPQPLEQQVFTDAVKEYKPGSELKLKVLRAGKAVDVNVKLDARPTDDAIQQDGGVDGFAYRRLREAEGYWKRTFGVLLESDDGAVR